MAPPGGSPVAQRNCGDDSLTNHVQRDSADTGFEISAIEGGARSLGQAGAVLSRKERVQVFGIDCTGPCGDGILFKGGEWAPGGEYVQRLRVKNVSPKLKKLKYRLPTTTYFALAYPEVITLSPGTMQEVDVVFRPISSEVYDDVILFKVLDGPNAGGFNVPVRALLPTLQVAIPAGLDLGYCQADDVSERVFHIINTGEVAAPFLWVVPPPFMMSPVEGVVAVGESKAVTCSVRPVDASVFVSQAALRVGQGVNAIKPKPLLEMKVSAIGKYSYVVPSENEIDFGSQTVGAPGGASAGDRASHPRKEFSLRNQSVVPASFTIRRLEGDRDAVFSVHPVEGVIPPEEELVVTATYSPVSAGTFSRDHYEVAAVGGNKVTVGIQGRAVGCTVRLEKKEDPFARGYGVPDSVNFREVRVGVTTSRVVYVYNESSTSCRFCFALQGETSIFRFSRTRGSIPPAGTDHPGEAQVTLTFTPRNPTNYYRRIFCLLENQLPLVLDAIGTGYVVAKGDVQEQRPAPLRHAHVQAFRNREGVGLGRCSPEELDEIIKDKGMTDMFAKVGPQGTPPLQRCRVPRPLTRSGEATRLQTAVASEFFVDPTDPFLNGVYLDRSSVDFGFSSASGEETISLTNSSNTEVHVVWNIRSPRETDGEEGSAGLRVTPLEADVPAGGSFPFQVAVSPAKGNCYFEEEAEAFISPANQMTFRMVKDATQQPPWFLPLRVQGHTFLGEQFLAKASLSTQTTGQRLAFPACHVGDTVYQTIRLSNQGNIPACFSFNPDPTAVFEIKPAVGLVPAGDFQLCLVRFSPPDPGGRFHRLACVLNNDPGTTQEVDLFGQGAVPAIQVICGGWDGGSTGSQSLCGSSLGSGGSDRDGHAMMYLRPTCVGIVSSGTITVKNISRIPVIYAIEPPKASSGVLKVSPLVGLLLGNQTATLQVIFAPRESKGYRFKFPVKVRSILGDAPCLSDCRQLGEAMPAVFSPGTSVTILGQGKQGAVVFHPNSLAYSVRLVNTPESKVLVLENCSECDVTYKLFYIANKEPPSRRSSKASTNSGRAEERRREGLRPVPKENGEAKGQGGANTTDALFIDKPQGTLPARSRTRTIATFRPVSEGEYDFEIVCQVSTATKAGDDGVPLPPLLAEMAEQGHKARAVEAQLEDTEEAGSGKKEGERDGSPLKRSNAGIGIMPLRCSVSGRASFPTVIFRDVRMTAGRGRDVRGASPRNLWSALSLSAINSMLSKPLSEEEVRYNQESSPDTSKLPRFDFPFFPAVIGGGPVVITLQVCNPGFLRTSVTVNLPNAKPVEMETWANEGEPTAEELRQNEIIDRLKVFALTPESGTVIGVSPGESQTLRIAYSADSLSYGGVHNLPVLVSIKEGRQFWLDLKGTTLPPKTPMLYVPTGLGRQFVLEPVAVGTPLTEAPLQTTEILNVGEAPLSYRVDGPAIKRANNSQGHGAPVFRLEEKTGIIAGSGSAFLRWRFVPLEAKEYVLRVVIRTEDISGGEFGEEFGEATEDYSLDVTLRGIGYDPRARDPHREIYPPVDLGLVHPPRQLEIPPEQYCVLGVERLRVGRIPQGAVFSRVVSIRNFLPFTAVEFSWDPSDTGVDNPMLTSSVVSIRPLKGTLDAGQSALLQVNVNAECGPRFLAQRPVACLVRQVRPTTATPSRKPKSRLEARLEEERQARIRVPDPRVPVVSRPTVSRTNHMAELAKDLSTRNGNDTSGRILAPHYPMSTVNATVPRALAEALQSGTPAEDTPDTGVRSHSRGTSRAEATSGLDEDATGAGPWQGFGGGVTNQKQNISSANSRGQLEHYNKGEDAPRTAQDVACILRLEIEGEVVCQETYRTLFGRRGEAQDRFDLKSGDTAEGFDGRSDGVVGTIDAFVIPRPAKYVPDWTAYGNGDHDTSGNAHHDISQQRESASRQTTGRDVKLQHLLKCASQDALVGDVASRVVKRLMGDVVRANEVQGCFERLPSEARVLTYAEIQNVPPLPDRLAAALAPLLERTLLPISPVPPTAASFAVDASRSGPVNHDRVNCNTPLEKKCLLAALDSVVFRVPVIEAVADATGGPDCGEQAARQPGAKRRNAALAGLMTAVKALPGSEVTLLDLVSILDNNLVRSLDTWLERRVVERAGRSSISPIEPVPGAAAAGARTSGGESNVKDGDAAKLTPGSSPMDRFTEDSKESKAALAIQSQARRRQAVQAAEEAAEKRLERLADSACQDPDTQRTVAAALEGTFFNLVQEAVSGEFNLSKRPTRFAIRKPSPKPDRGSKGGSARVPCNATPVTPDETALDNCPIEEAAIDGRVPPVAVPSH